jgi:type IVB pilus formation R64 PilN family outer membrane protein
MDRLMPQNTVGVQYETSMSRSKPISINYQGPLRGALDKIAAKTGYAYDISGSGLTWSGFVTKTFDISFMPGSSQYLVGQKQGDTLNSMTSGGSNVSTGQAPDSQFSSLQANLSVWKDLNNAIKEMLSPQGKVMVSESTTTVTVRDHAENVQEVADYLASMNRDLSKEVLLQVQVLQIALNTDFNLGVNWNLAYNSAYSGFTGSNNAIQSNPIMSNTTGTPGISAGILSGPFKNTSLLINALGNQGTVSNITNPEVVTLNNQVAQIDISRQTTYLASSTNTVSGASGSTGFSQTTLNPGVVNTGFKLYILPKILHKNIYMEVSSELSTLQSMNTFTVGGATAASPGSSSLQLPVVDGKHFNLRSVVPSGSTLIIAGFNSVDNVAQTSSSFAVDSGANSKQKDVQTILLITPTILGKQN